MVSDRKNLAGEIEDLRRRVESSRYLLSREKRESYLAGLDSIGQRLSAATQPLLHVGLLGGTGVGKSTLINALAEEPISSVSDRRPHTDRIVVYRHDEISLHADFPSHLLNEPHQTHRNSRIRHLIAYDFPDFDSILTGHLEQVSAFLTHLDLVVWVTSPEKYADLRFYEVLRDCEKHQDNFIFVLNKLDKVSSSNEESLPEAARLIGDFSLKLKDAGIHAPRIYHFAAREAQNPQAPPRLRHDFLKFREALFRRRDGKEILAIKAANVEVELEGLWKELRSFVLRLALIRPELESLMQHLQDRLPTLKHRCSLTLEQFFTQRTSAFLRRSILSRQEDVAPVSLLRGLWKQPAISFAATEDRSGWESPLAPDDDRLSRLRDELTIPLDSIATLLHRFALPQAARELEDLENDLHTDMKSILVQGAERFSGLVQSISLPWEGWTGSMRRASHRFWLAIPAILLILALAGPENVESLFDNPDMRGTLLFILNVLLSLFKPEGLVCLLTFVVLEILASLWLASRTSRSADRRVLRARRKFNDELAQETFERMKAQVRNVEDMGTRLVDEIGTLVREGVSGGST